MWSVFKKELNSFLTSLVGYLTIFVFLILNGLFVWIIHSSANVFDSGSADIDGLFFISPWIFIFLIAAITMRMFAEEKRSGTIETLLTSPVSDLKIIFAKFLSSLTIVALSILPTMVYMVAIYNLAVPMGNIDIAGILGSYIGLVFLGGVFCSIGVFCSSLTNNQIIAFIFSVILSLIIYLGFDAISLIPALQKYDLTIQNLGIMYHYDSMSRGVIDTRDVIYFLSTICLFILLTKISLQSRLWDKKTKKKDIRRSHIIQLSVGIAMIIFINIVSAFLFTKIDLTKEGKYSLSHTTKTMLKGGNKQIKKIDDVVMVRCYLDGNIPAMYKELRNATKDLLDEMRSYNSNIEYEFSDPNDFKTNKEKAEFYQKLLSKGFQPLLIQTQEKGKQEQQYIFPYIEVSYGGRTTFKSLISTSAGFSNESVLQSSIQNLEYTLYSAIQSLIRGMKPSIAFLYGQNEPDATYFLDIIQSLNENYLVDSVTINGKINALVERTYDSVDNIRFRNKYACLIIANPLLPFTQKDLYVIDQYIMHGGKILCLIDPLTANMDSLQSKASTMAISRMTGLEDMLFEYGARLNNDLVMDLQCVKVPIVTGQYSGNRPQMTFYPWNFFPQSAANPNSVITSLLGPVKFEFVSTIDSVENNGEVKFTPLLYSSENTRLLNAPVQVSLQMLKQKQDPKLFNQGKKVLAMLMEGNFVSAFRSRLPEEMLENQMIANRNSSDTTAMIVIADADIIRNDFRNGQVVPLGYDIYTGQMFANKEFLVNCVDYLSGGKDIISLRSREVVIRKLDMAKVDRERTFWQMFCMLLPIGIAILPAIAFILVRKRNRL